MNDSNNNDFTPEEKKLITDTLAERFGKLVGTQLTDIELKRAEESA